MFTTPYALVSLSQCLCFCLSLIAISFTLRGWRDQQNLAVICNTLGLWIGLVALDFAYVNSAGLMHLLLAQSVYLMLRKRQVALVSNR